MELSHLAQNKSHKKRENNLNSALFFLYSVEIRRFFGGFLHFMWLFSRALALCRTFVRRREPNHAFCI